MCTVLIVASSSCGASGGRIILVYVYIFVGCNNRRVSLGMGQRHVGIGKVTDIVLLEWVHKDRHDSVDGFLEVGDEYSFLDVSCGLYAGRSIANLVLFRSSKRSRRGESVLGEAHGSRIFPVRFNGLCVTGQIRNTA